MCGFTALVVLSATLVGQPLGAPIVNDDHEYLVWGDYKIEVNQYGDLGRNWPTPTLVWEQYARLKAKAQTNPEPPTTLRAALLVLPNIEATALREVDGEQVEVGHKSSRMTSDEVKWALEQWRQFEEMVFVYSGGNAWVRTDIRVVDEPVPVTTDENWVFWPGPQRELMDRFLPFERGGYQSYNCIYSSKGLNADPHGGTFGAVIGIKGCGTSDNAHYGDDWKPNRTGYVALHEWMNQQCAATSNILPYPDEEALWNNYVLHKIGYREDVELDDWPWMSARRDTMLHIIRPGMWKRWSTIDPYVSDPIGQWRLFGPGPKGMARQVSAASDDEGVRLEQDVDRMGAFDLADAMERAGVELTHSGVCYVRTHVASAQEQEVRLWAGGDERFELWLNGRRVRDGWGWNYSEDDGQLFEKLTNVTLEKGVNTLVLALPNTDDRAEFRVRFCDVDGTGKPPGGVTTSADLGGRLPVRLREPETPDFSRPRVYSWADINDMPWTKLPRMGEEELRALTGVADLRVVSSGPERTDEDGQTYEPQQHLFLDVPAGAVRSPRRDMPGEDAAWLDNDLDFNWESMAWVRCLAREGPEKDVVLLRFDVAEPLMHLLRTRGRDGQDSLVGWLLVDHKLAYVLLVDLDVENDPGAMKALELLRMKTVREER